MQDKAIESAQNNRVKDPSSPVFSCMLSQWNAKLVDSETDLSSNIETYDVFGYERFLACYRSASKIGAAGEIGVDTETTGLNLSRDRLCLIQIGVFIKQWNVL